MSPKMVQSVSSFLSQGRSTTEDIKCSSSDQTPNHFLRLCVRGAHGVGKSAVVVRYLTRRFIGEYHSGVDITYHHIVNLSRQTAFLEIWDFSAKAGDSLLPLKNESDGDCHLVVFSITDYCSFLSALRIANTLQKSQRHPQLTLLGNKVDLEHCRQVSTEEATKAAEIIPCKYAEVSVAEARESVVPVIHELLSRALNAQTNKIAYHSTSSPCVLPNETDICTTQYKHLPTMKSYNTLPTLPKDAFYSDQNSSLLKRSFSQRQNPLSGLKFQNSWLDRSSKSDKIGSSSPISRNNTRSIKYRTLDTYSRSISFCTSKSSGSSDDLEAYFCDNNKLNEKKSHCKREMSPLPFMFSRSRAQSVNGSAKSVKQPLEMRPSVEIVQEDKKNTKNRKSNSRFLTLVSSFAAADAKLELRNKYQNASIARGYSTRMVVNGDNRLNNNSSNIGKPPIFIPVSDRSNHKPKTSDPTHNNSKRKFGVFGITALGNVFSKNSLPDIPKATASLYTKFGSIKNTIKKRSV